MGELSYNSKRKWRNCIDWWSPDQTDININRDIQCRLKYIYSNLVKKRARKQSQHVTFPDTALVFVENSTFTG